MPWDVPCRFPGGLLQSAPTQRDKRNDGSQRCPMDAARSFILRSSKDEHRGVFFLSFPRTQGAAKNNLREKLGRPEEWFICMVLSGRWSRMVVSNKMWVDLRSLCLGGSAASTAIVDKVMSWKAFAQKWLHWNPMVLFSARDSKEIHF